MTKQVTRRGFVEGVALTGATMAVSGMLAGCEGSGGSGETSDPTAAPAADSYPIEPEEWGSGTVRYATEVAGDERTYDNWTRVTNEGGTTLGVWDTSKLIQVDGFAFKDLDGDGKLSLWEDWRQSADDRAAALAETLSAEDIAPLMANFSIPALNDDFDDEFTCDFANSPTSTTQTIEQGVRTMLLRMNYEYRLIARWSNRIQAACEAAKNGIPMMCSSDPVTFGIPDNLARAATFDPELTKEANILRGKAYRSVGVATELGPQIDITTDPRWCRIAATFGEDPALSRDMARASCDGFQSTYDEDGNDLGWGADSVICEVKHFPGDGSGEGGRESHKFMGKFSAYPTNNFPAHLIAFFDGAFNLDGKTECAAAAMPSYAIAFSEDGELGELVGSAFSEYKIGLLRNNGFDGVVCSDWGVVESLDECFAAVPWGVEEKSRAERIAKLIAAGSDQVGGGADLGNTLAAYDLLVEELGEEAALSLMREAGRRIVKASFLTGLFDNPYVDSSLAQGATESEEIDAFAKELALKSIVMLKNSDGVICERTGKPTVYIPMAYTPASQGMFGSTPASVALCADEELAGEYFTVVTDALGEPTGPADEDGAATYQESDIVRASAEEIAACDFALVLVASPASGGYGGGYDEAEGHYIPLSVQYGDYVADGASVRQTSLTGDPADGSSWADHDWSAAGVEIEDRNYVGYPAVEPSNKSDLDLILDTVASAGDVPVVVGITADRPMCFGEFEDKVAAILMDYGTGTDEALLAIAAGTAEPSGLLPLQQPRDMEAVEAQSEDAPRDMECYVDAAGNEYDFGFGLNWSGPISDERTEKYCVEPLTRPESIDI